MTNELALSLENIIWILMRQIMLGRAHLRIAIGIRSSDPAILHSGEVFFGLTEYAHLATAQMYAARLYDKKPHTVTIRKVLDCAERSAGTFSSASAEQVRGIVRSAKEGIARNSPVLAALSIRRNEELAHLSAQAAFPASDLESRAPLTIQELTGLFDDAGAILNELSGIRNGPFTNITLLDCDDYKNAFGLIAKAKCAQIREIEATGQIWSGLRPKGCSQD